MKLFQKNSNAYDHSPPTLQTDNLSWQYCAALRVKTNYASSANIAKYTH